MAALYAAIYLFCYYEPKTGFKLLVEKQMTLLELELSGGLLLWDFYIEVSQFQLWCKVMMVESL